MINTSRKIKGQMAHQETIFATQFTKDSFLLIKRALKVSKKRPSRKTVKRYKQTIHRREHANK